MHQLLPDPLSRDGEDFCRRLKEERFLFDLDDGGSLDLLRGDIARIARGMDDDSSPPPMLWSGIPWPRRRARSESEWCLVISVGGTKTNYLLVRLEEGRVVALDASGRKVTGEAVDEARRACCLPTPTHDDASNGFEMVARIAERISEYLRAGESHLESCRNILLSWGFAQRVVRTAEHLLGGLTAYTTRMTKDQSGFNDDLEGKDIGELFAKEFRRRLGWSRPVTVANDSVMALHYFLSHERRERHSQIGLFINGTGTNFCLPEPYAVRSEGVVSRADEVYEPRRVREDEEIGPRESRVLYLVNYETGSIELGATRTRFDVVESYPIESNVLSGGNAFEQQFRDLTGLALGEDGYRSLLRSARHGDLRARVIEGPQVAALAEARPDGLERFFPGVELAAADREKIVLLSKAVVTRSALHAALILAAVTSRRRFGLGDGRRSDLLGMEGSVWKTSGYPELVRAFWEKLAGSPLDVEVDAEEHFSASSRGPLYLTLLQHDESSRREDEASPRTGGESTP